MKENNSIMTPSTNKIDSGLVQEIRNLIFLTFPIIYTLHLWYQ